MIEVTLQKSVGHSNDEAVDSASTLVWLYWSFPLWSVDLTELKPSKKLLTELRAKREQEIERIQETEARREPAPSIERQKVEELSEAHAAWQNDIRESEAMPDAAKEGTLRIRKLSGFAYRQELLSYRRIRKLFDALSSGERTDLVDSRNNREVHAPLSGAP